ncbi:MAG: hypothetical protein OYI31_00865 [Chloroflexota bacterium]|nr:hypothetical protein [Chloroflexota bacterium]MDE2940939.1 hypothetical protein [Chloroflexota bacterium]MDE3267001.1 hypothetical protein [Chloroflexota bacterium]
MVLRGHTLMLLVAALGAPRRRIAYGAAVRRAVQMMGTATPTRADVSAFSRSVRRLHAMGLVDMEVRLRRVRTIASRRGHRLSTRQWRRAGRAAGPTRLRPIDAAEWASHSDEAREERLGEFATAAFRVMISNATLFLSLGLSATEAVRALGRTVPPSVASALSVAASHDRRSLLQVSYAVTGQSDEAQEPQMFASQEYPASWAFRMPPRGRQQLEAALAVAEVVRLARDNGLDKLVSLKRFRVRV